MSVQEIVLITGGSGMIAQHLSALLEDAGYEVRFLSRYKKSEKHFIWNIKTGFIDANAFNNLDHIIHLAGTNISEKRWTNQRKIEILESRTQSTQLLFDAVNNHPNKLKTLIATSAVGFYGTSNQPIEFNEDSPAGTDFLASVCKEWETASSNFRVHQNSRVATLRLGVVLSKNGGALEKMANPIKLHMGAVLGSGDQYIPWIHIDDLCEFIKFAIENKEIEGIYNAVAPQHINNKEFTFLLAKKLQKKIWLPNIPDFVLNLILGEMATIVLKGNAVSSNKLCSTSFKFKYPTLEQALDNLIE